MEIDLITPTTLNFPFYACVDKFYSPYENALNTDRYAK